jgi:hypothetical protein
MARKRQAQKTGPQYRVLRAFAHDGTYYTNDNAADLGSLSDAVREDRTKRGHIAEHGAPVPPAPSAQE